MSVLTPVHDNACTYKSMECVGCVQSSSMTTGMTTAPMCGMTTAPMCGRQLLLYVADKQHSIHAQETNGKQQGNT